MDSKFINRLAIFSRMAKMMVSIADLCHNDQLLLEENKLDIGDMLDLGFCIKAEKPLGGIVYAIQDVKTLNIPGRIEIRIYSMGDNGLLVNEGCFHIENLNTFYDWTKIT